MTREEYLAQPELPVILTFKLAFQQLLDNLHHLARFAIPLFLLLLVAPFLGVSVPPEGQPFDGYWQTMAWIAIYWLAMIMVAINCHQLFILGPEQSHQLKTWRWGRREWRFLGYGIVFALILMVLSIPFVVAGMATWSLFDNDVIAEWVFMVLLMIPLAYLMARLMLVFPAIAIGETFSWSDARRLSAHFQYRLILLIGLLPLVTSTLTQLIPNQDVPWVYTVTHLIWLPVLAFELCVLSLCYCYLTHTQEQPVTQDTEAVDVQFE
ncbi:MAG: hypothetical protein LAT62_16300 [Natronospirillum sp.]|uniref:hypothetical protein n=1 Tax=Natronospirillum sp. TaxID=2812955 RepID=UPI0025E5474A|nr:hypothetical protein [Natronospirillum sp.]MCH8553500.1 hypothetical protein [Natronospirillum sp.]